MIENSSRWPTLTLPPDESQLLQQHYASARVILEYGSGGSTVFAAQHPDKLIFSVESDRAWFLSLQRKCDEADLPSSPIFYHADIGKTGAWGRPVDDRLWSGFYRYPLGIWAESFFRQPELVLIDGRLRPACFLATCINTRAPVTVLFDDYLDRCSYKVVEELVRPTTTVGRMAVFHITPREWPAWAHALLAELCTKMSYAPQEGQKTPDYYASAQSEVLSHAQLLTPWPGD